MFKINQVFCDLDLSQSEALSTIHQVFDFGVLINNCTKCHHIHDCTPGTQLICFHQGSFEFSFDGKSHFLKYLNPLKRS